MELNSFERNGVTYYELYVTCPSCLELGRNISRTYLIHHNNSCHGNIYIGDNGDLLCSICGARSNILNWKILCPNCNYDDSENLSLEEVSDEGMQLKHAVGIASQMAQKTGISWLEKFLYSFKEEKEKMNNNK